MVKLRAKAKVEKLQMREWPFPFQCDFLLFPVILCWTIIEQCFWDSLRHSASALWNKAAVCSLTFFPFSNMHFASIYFFHVSLSCDSQTKQQQQQQNSMIWSLFVLFVGFSHRCFVILHSFISFHASLSSLTGLALGECFFFYSSSVYS